MTLIVRKLLTVTIFASLQCFAFSQGTDSARSLYLGGKSLIKNNPAAAFHLLERAMNSARRNQEWQIYLLSVNSLAQVDLDDQLSYSKNSREISTDLKRQEEEVFAWLKEAVETLKNASEDSILAQLHYTTGEYYYKMTNEIDRPVFHYQKAKKMWTALKGEWSEEVSNCYHGLGNIYKYYKFDFYEAEKCYEKALLIREKIGFDDLDALYKNYYSLATTNRSQHDFEKALSYGTKALELAKQFGPKQLGPVRTEMSSGMLANIYRDMNQSSMAKKHYLNALALNKKTNDRENRAWYYNSLGETFKNDSSFSEAAENFERAYQIYKSSDVKRSSQYISLLINMVGTYSVLPDEKKFLRIKNEALAMLDSLNMRKSTEASQIWLLIGRHHMVKEKLDSALFYFQKSLIAMVPGFTSGNFQDNPTEDMIGYRYRINETLINKALALNNKFLQTRNVAWLYQSLASFRLAEKLLSKQRNTLDMEDAKWKFLESKYDIYEDIISSLYAGAQALPVDTLNMLVFQYFEQSKSRSLADALAETEQTRKISEDDSLLQIHADLKRQLLSAQDALSKSAGKSDPADKVASLRDEVIRLDKNIQSVKFAIEEKYPGYFNVKYGYKPIDLSHVQKMMTAKDQVLLEYFWGKKSIYALGVNDKIISFKRIGSPDSIQVIINELLAHLTNPRSGMTHDVFNSFKKSAGALYQIMIKPFDDLLSTKKSIQIIPDGSISQIPFEILLDAPSLDAQVNYKSLNYLIKSFTIGYAYSTAMFLRKAVVRRATPSLLAMGFTGGQGVREDNGPLSEIKGAEEELETLKKKFHTGKFLTGNDATESNFKSMAPEYDIIHLAVHGSGDLKKNFAASLYFRFENNLPDDGELHAYELYGLKLKALMAVLSSCESGLGKGYKGEGMISMASAFTYSGCENILMSLWKVNDQAATGLMDDFYEQLLEGKSIDDALRQAKLNYLEQADELTAHPKIWAALIAYGNLDKVFQKDRSIMVVVGAFGMLAIFVLSFAIYNRYRRG